MIYKTRGIVFRFTRYGETSIIVNIFTELFGMQSYIVNGIRSKTSKSKMALFQPLTLLDMVVYHRENANLNRIKEVKCLHPYLHLTGDVKRTSVAMFVSEVVNKTIKEESHATELCEFLIDSMIALDKLSTQPENFHLIFLLKLSRFLGFGVFHRNEIIGGKVVSPELEEVIDKLIHSEYDQSPMLTLQERRALVDLFLAFYADHIDTLGEIKSVEVLREVMR